MVFLFVCALASCKVADEDRCPEGYEYVRKRMYCRLPKNIDDNQSKHADAGAAEGGVGGGDDTSDSEMLNIGEACSSDDECSGPADYCVTTTSGYCTITGCSAGGCPDSYVCCDCSDVEDYGDSACLTTGDAALAPLIGCICE